MSLVAGIWWYGFAREPSTLELGVGGALAALFFLIVTIVVSAALLSFSIYELGRIPSIHQRSRGGPIAAAAGILVILMFMPALQSSEPNATAPEQVVTSPTQRRVALVGVDGLTYEILQSRPELVALFAAVHPRAPSPPLPRPSGGRRSAPACRRLCTECAPWPASG